MKLPSSARTLATAIAACGCIAGAVAAHTPQPQSAPASSPTAIDKQDESAEIERTLAKVEQLETDTINRMIANDSWVRRAVVALRLERFTCSASQEMLIALLRDQSWQVRAFAVRALSQRQVKSTPEWFAIENEPRVIRTALRLGYEFDAARLKRGIHTLSQSNNLLDKLLAAELAVASGNDELKDGARENIRHVILRMNRTEAGALSPRLATLTGQYSIRRPHQWQQWLMKTGRNLTLRSVDAKASAKPTARSMVAQLDTEQFAGLDQYMTELSEHEVDLAIALDCTASMSGEIMAAQGGIDDMMTFVGDVVSSVRIALVAYRDRSDEYEAKGWDFNDDVNILREQLWQLSADGGGDEPEAVHPAMRLAFTQLQWRNDAEKVFVIVGDAPPHPGYGGLCAQLATQARNVGVTTHMIEAKGKSVKYFAEIAEAGGGRCVSLRDSDTLIAEITGLTLGERFVDEFREFFRVYLELCR